MYTYTHTFYPHFQRSFAFSLRCVCVCVCFYVVAVILSLSFIHNIQNEKHIATVATAAIATVTVKMCVCAVWANNNTKKCILAITCISSSSFVVVVVVVVSNEFNIPYILNIIWHRCLRSYFLHMTFIFSFKRQHTHINGMCVCARTRVYCKHLQINSNST